ncbi:capsular polysaccharide export protein, LipB/KpsS family [Candidatus Pelagibacter sp. HIMB1517]|uniref:capsular polysaccharide export protein, LipB/KpsS family n=1 Tax=Candidatus Pelagibacter sp. HIMB1517 TaxID=3413341 RepID=UPI003F82B9C6
MKVLFYIPTSLNNPEFEILLSKAQNHITEKNNVTILTCNGGKNYSCSINLYSNPGICYLCNKFKKKAFDRLKGNFKLFKTGKFEKKNYFFSNYLKLKKFRYDKIDIGLASYSSYVANTKDHLLQGKIAREITSKNLNTTINFYKFFKKFLKYNSFDVAFIYNGRQNQYRPLFRLCKKKKIKVIILEYRGPNYKNVYEYINHLPTDYYYQSERVKDFYDNFNISEYKKKQITNYYYKSLRLGKKIQDKVSYTKNQKYDLLPENFNKNDNNITIFNSSEDEYAALGGIYDKIIFKNQTKAIDWICKKLKRKNSTKIKLWLRIHPNLKNVKWPYIDDLYKLERKYHFLNIVSANSKISSYSLLFNSEKIITFGSNMGIEAVYYKKPAILLNRIPYETLNCQYIPKSKQQLLNQLTKKLSPKSILGSTKYALFKMCGGQELKGFKGSYDVGFSFHNHRIKKNLIWKFFYVIFRLIDKVYFLYFKNIGIKRLFKSYN